MYLKRIVFPLFLLITFAFSNAEAEVLKTINVSMPTNYGTFFGEIHYSEKDLALALRIERIIKEDLIKVINYFEYVPYDVVHFNLDPFMRLTNGNARIFPTNIINLYNFPASNLDHLIVMENWLQGLVLHEFVHITHLDQTRDYLFVARQLFGTVAKVPAGIVPRWFTEGIAVWGESHLINGGRLNNELFNKELLIQFKKPNFCKTIDCLDTPGNYPNGQLAYWAGAHFIEYLENKKPKTIKCLVEMNSASLPFFLNNSFEACVGEKAQDLFTKFYEEYTGKENIPADMVKAQWGENIGNVFGSNDYQKGLVIDHDRLFKVEHQKQREALVFYDLKDEVSFTGQFNAPIAEVASMVDIDNENKMLLVSFNDDSTFRIQNKNWKLINPDTLLVERILNFPHDPSYVVSLGAENYLTFSYWQNAWQAENNGEVLRIFPGNYNIVLVKKIGGQILLKINDANGISSLILCDLKLQKLNVIYKSDKAYDLPLITDNYLVIRENKELKLLEFTGTVQQSVLPQKTLEGITFAHFNDERSLVLENNLRSVPRTAIDSEKIIKKDKTETRPVEMSELKLNPTPTSSFASEKAESYPRLDHLIPHYWFLAVGNSDNISSFGAMTTFVDPMEIHFLNATALIYPSVKKTGGTLEYYQKLIQVSDLWSATAYLNQDYFKTDFNSSLNLSRDFKLRTSYKFLYKQWTYLPGVFAGAMKTEDFISNRTVKNLGSNHALTFQALTYDDFFQYFSGSANLQINKANIRSAYLLTQLQAEGGFRFIPDFMGTIKGSYSKLFKSDFIRGVDYAGGISDFTKTRFHEFYGLPYSNAFGNEIFSTRLSLDYNFWDIYRGKNLIPFFFKETHLIFGSQSLYADRIILDDNVLKDRMITALFIGPRLKMNMFYSVPANLDLIFSSIANPNGRNVNTVDFSITADFF